MSKQTETGHAKNAALYGKAIDEAEGYGSAYNPSNAALSIAEMNLLRTDINTCFTNMGNQQDQLTIAFDERQLIFDRLLHLCPYIVSEAIACGADEKTIEDIYQITRLIYGRRAVPIPKEDKSKVNPSETDAEKAPESDPAPKVRRSASHTSFHNKANYFDKLTSLMALIPLYNPNEADLSVVSLRAISDDAKSSTHKVQTLSASVEQSRILRDKLLYHPVTGALKRVKMLKNYVKARFGANSIEYKTLTAMNFVSYKYRGIV